MKVLSNLGQSPRAIARRMGKSHHTVAKYLQSDVYSDPTIQEIIGKIRAKELEDLYLLGAKGRQRLHELLDQGNTKMIETIALVDRTFGQRRLLEDKSTHNFSVHSGKSDPELDEEIQRLEDKLAQLEKDSAEDSESEKE